VDGGARCGLESADLGALDPARCRLHSSRLRLLRASTEPGRREAGLPSTKCMPSCAPRDTRPGPPAHRQHACVSQHSPRHGRRRWPWAWARRQSADYFGPLNTSSPICAHRCLRLHDRGILNAARWARDAASRRKSKLPGEQRITAGGINVSAYRSTRRILLTVYKTVPMPG
jgi:hypothetical protein